MRIFLLLLTLLTARTALAAPQDPWVVDAGASRLAFNATQLSTFVNGRLPKWTGEIVLDPAVLGGARIDIRIDMRAAATGKKDVDDLLLGKDFLDVQRFPEARFVSTSIVSKGGDNYEARGKLTICDVTRDIVLPFALAIRQETANARGRLEIKRLDYGVGRNEWAGTNYVANEVTIDIAIVASRPR